jgi:hypothetical protein
MTQAYCERRPFPVPTRWLYAGSDLSRPDHGDQCAARPLARSERLPRCPLQAPHLTCPHIPIEGQVVGVADLELQRQFQSADPTPGLFYDRFRAIYATDLPCVSNAGRYPGRLVSNAAPDIQHD